MDVPYPLIPVNVQHGLDECLELYALMIVEKRFMYVPVLLGTWSCVKKSPSMVSISPSGYYPGRPSARSVGQGWKKRDKRNTVLLWDCMAI
jgi:hypothetical protein